MRWRRKAALRAVAATPYSIGVVVARAELVRNISWLQCHPARVTPFPSVRELAGTANPTPESWWNTFRASVALYRARLAQVAAATTTT